jgi:restriction endonuclease S subunit
MAQISIIQKSDIIEARRFDAEYFQPKYFDIIKKIQEHSGGFDVIKNIVCWKKGIKVGKSAYTEIGKDFVRVSDISMNGIEISNRKISNTLFTEIKDTFQPKKNEILFTKDGTIGISYLLKENVEGVISSAFLRLTLKNDYQGFEKECLTLILNSIICKLQIKQLSGGAIIAHLKPSDFEKFKIPLIKQSIQIKISEKITLSHKLRKESQDLLELAKTKVEEEIEK